MPHNVTPCHQLACLLYGAADMQQFFAAALHPNADWMTPEESQEHPCQDRKPSYDIVDGMLGMLRVMTDLNGLPWHAMRLLLQSEH